ncbi:MAG: hypothetical protein WBW32_06345, partial [Luteibacter sp.]
GLQAPHQAEKGEGKKAGLTQSSIDKTSSPIRASSISAFVRRRYLNFFRPESQDVLWRRVGNWLSRQVGGSSLRRRSNMP